MSREVFKKALDTWGKDVQLNMLQEECAELIAAVNHLRRGRATEAEVCAEIADVQIMLDQMKLVFSSEDIEGIYNFKVSILKGRLK